MIAKCILPAIFAASLSVASSASALTITSIDGTWMNASAGVKGEGTDQIRWGKRWKRGKKSGYSFVAEPTNLVAQEETPFVFGTFNHLNFPVTGKFLKKVDLAVTFTIEGVSGAISSVFSFEHEETLNKKRNCANGEKNRQGVNIKGCADHVTATLNEGKSSTFEIDGVTYILDVLGFQYNGQLLNDFWTIEKQNNKAELVAVFRTVEGENPPIDPPSEPPSEVPLPASGLLLLAGLAGLYAKSRRS